MRVHKKLFADFPPVPTEAWEERIRKDLKGKDYARTLLWYLDQDLPVRPYYRSEDLGSLPPSALAKLPCAGDGQDEARPRPQNVEVCQSIAARDPETANAQARKMIPNGIEALAFVLNTSDFANCGACEIRQAREMQRLLDGIDLNTKRVHFLTGLTTLPFLELLTEELKRQNFDNQKFYSRIEHDLFTHWLRQGSLPYSLGEAFAETAALLKYSKQTLPRIRCMCIAEEAYHASGTYPVQALGLLLAMAHELLIYLASDFTFEEILPRLWFQVSVSSEYFLEIARLRALRLLWPQLIQAY